MQWNWRLERRPVEYVDITMHEIYSRHAGQEFKFAYSTKGEEFLNKAFLDSKIAGPYGPSLFSLGCFSPFHRRTLKKKAKKRAGIRTDVSFVFSESIEFQKNLRMGKRTTTKMESLFIRLVNEI